ncbi:DNA methyltransferase, partial [Campylobacter coli]|nr:DNA methyltransferase [Campylobacter coli]
TPKSIVDMIVSSLDELLKTKLNKNKGFNDQGVKVLDFATGTGSFLASVFEKIISKESEVFKNEAIKNKFLKDIYGFELSFVPYIVARLKLGQILRKNGFVNFSDADFQIFLNNTLDLEKIANFDMFMPLENLDTEWKKARDVKHSQDLLVILGNPPYNVKSKNKGEDILELLKIYKQGLNDKNIQSLNDDYIKFMRFAQWKLLEQNKKDLFEEKKGLLGFITNNSFINGKTHRKMRESLYKSFDEIYILNLHGSDKDAKNDENVFDIKVGVCISLFVKYKDEPSNGAKVFYYSTGDNNIFSRKEKFALLDDVRQKGLNAIKWEELSLDEPYFWFIKREFKNKEYENFWALASDKAEDKKSIFLNYSSGIQTEKDNIAIQLNKQSMENVLKDFKNLTKEENVKKYNLDNSIILNTLTQYENNTGFISKIHYRPFDIQWTFYSEKQGF